MAILWNKSIKEFSGIVVSASMAKTLVVEVRVESTHPLYKKVFTRKKKFYVHDEDSKAQIGDTVTFRETRPLSKTKRWLLVSQA